MSTIVAFCVALVFVVAVVELLRRKRLREKFAVLWLVVGLATLVLAGFPQLLEWASRSVGVQVPANLLFAMSTLLLMSVCLHLSLTLTNVEDQTRVLAEEVALLRFQVELGPVCDPQGSEVEGSPVTSDQKKDELN